MDVTTPIIFSSSESVLLYMKAKEKIMIKLNPQIKRYLS